MTDAIRQRIAMAPAAGAEGFFEKLHRIGGTVQDAALLALAKSYRSIAGDRALDHQAAGEMAMSSRLEFADHCAKHQLGDLSAAADLFTKSILEPGRGTEENEANRQVEHDQTRDQAIFISESGDDQPMTKNRDQISDEMTAIAKRERKPQETIHQAYARCMKANPEMKKLYDAFKAAPEASRDPIDPTVLKRQLEPQDPGYQGIVAKAADIRKSQPQLSEEQAFARAWKDPANAHLREQHRSAQGGVAA